MSELGGTDKGAGKKSGEGARVDRFRRLEEIFLQASELEPGERQAFLDSACGDDLELRSEVAVMLGFEPDSETRLRLAVASGLEQIATEQVPERVGPYRILQPLGFGGLGSVYLAERDDGHFAKKVAIKWLRPESITVEQKRRFLLERQVLASLEHPNIARILDGGAHGGAAYLVMEWVEGQHLLEHCRERGMSVDEKLRLFRKVCDAVHHAHQSLILHCDLKPSNILVDKDGEPKLVDFGIAKALRGSQPSEIDTLAATRTYAGSRPLTPEYASPEQASYRPLTTASDLYSLGVVLFELLTGSRPYQVATQNPIEIAERITRVEAPKASSHFRTEKSAAAPWSSDLDAIVAKTMRKEPAQRYPSVERLSQDLLRYLERRPVTARRGTWVYHGGKLIARHRLAAAALLTVLFSLGAATLVTSRQARVAERERQRAEANLALAEEEKDRAETVVDLLVDIFEFSDPAKSQGAEVTAREVLDRGSKQIHQQLEQRPQLRAALANTIGRVYRQLAILDQAELHLSDSLETRRQILEEGSQAIVESLHQLARLRLDQNRLAEADQLLSEALNMEAANRSDGTSYFGELLLTQALLRLEDGQPREAQAALKRFFGEARGQSEDDLADRAQAWDLLAQVAYADGDYGHAEELALQGLETRRSVFGPQHPKIARSLNNLAAIRQIRGDLVGARSVLEETLVLRRKIYGDTHGSVALSLQNLAVIHDQEKDFDKAESRLSEALTITKSIYGENHPAAADVLFTWARMENHRGRTRAASDLHRQALEIRRLGLGRDHPKIILSLMGLADSLRRAEPRQAAALYREAIAVQREKPELHGHRRAYPLERLGTLLCDSEPAAAVEWLAEALAVRKASPAADHWHSAQGEARLGQCLITLDPVRAEQHLERGHQKLEAILGHEHPVTQRVRGQLDALRAQQSAGQSQF